MPKVSIRTIKAKAVLAWIIDEMEKLGLVVSIDTAGNILGKRDGTDPGLDPILFGSHIDSVPGGGNYDGDVGVIGALEVVSILQENDISTRHPLEVVVFSDEEGGMPGSLGMSGRFDPELFNTQSHAGAASAIHRRNIPPRSIWHGARTCCTTRS